MILARSLTGTLRLIRFRDAGQLPANYFGYRPGNSMLMKSNSHMRASSFL
jgi:hypothetical protein